jgi:hypothetical protein
MRKKCQNLAAQTRAPENQPQVAAQNQQVLELTKRFAAQIQPQMLEVAQTSAQTSRFVKMVVVAAPHSVKTAKCAMVAQTVAATGRRQLSAQPVVSHVTLQ